MIMSSEIAAKTRAELRNCRLYSLGLGQLGSIPYLRLVIMIMRSEIAVNVCSHYTKSRIIVSVT